MQTELNEKIKNFFQLPIEKFTDEEIKRNFDKNTKNEYGNLLHAVVQNKFDENKVLKFISLLLENGYNVNYKGEVTGYNFIQLALYGYTDDEDEEDYSYSQAFILKLINIAKKYDLDVNTKDNDGDSIIHTAIASEVYDGDVLPILDALGEHFDLTCRDNTGHNLQEAFDLYKEEAYRTNKVWFNRLQEEEKELKKRLKTSEFEEEKTKPPITEGKTKIDTLTKKSVPENFALEDIKKQEENVQEKLEEIINNIDVEYLIKNKTHIFSLKNQLKAILDKKSALTKEKNEFENIWKKYNELFKKVFSMEINKLHKQNDFEKLISLIKILEEYQFTEEQDLINEVIEEYKRKVEELTNKIKTELTLDTKKDMVSKISKLRDNDVQKLSTLLETFSNQLLTLIMEINKQIDLFGQIKIPYEDVDYSVLTNGELKVILAQNKKSILEKKEEILKEHQQKLESCIQEILTLEDTGVFENDELWNMIKSSTSKEVKVKKRHYS